MYLVNVILDIPLRCFSYVSEVTLTVGTRVLVEFGYKKMVGFVWQTNINKCDLECELSKIKPILTVFNEALAADIVALVKFVANYYHYPLGQTLFSGIPVGLRKPKPFALPQEVVFSLTESARDGKLSFKGKKQRELYQRLLSHPLTPAEIKAIIGNSYGKLIATWQAEQIISAYPVKAVASNLVVHNKIQLNLEQQQIVAQVSQYFGQFHCGILYGITGSGKTEVYLELIEQIILRHQQALVLVPEINLTPQLLARFKHRFANVGMHILTSSASEKERVIGYLGAQDGSKQIIIGTRLAVFTPFKNLGIIIVDEEHDQSFKQNDGLRYNARDLAVWRANYAKVPILLGSATPSLESLYNYKLGRYALYKMTARAVDSSKLPKIQLIDLNCYPAPNSLTELAVREIKTRLEQGELSLVFINRRGYCPIITCYSCGWVSSCKYCSTNMVYHTTSCQLKCHHCGWSATVPQACPKCDNQYLQAIGQGTQRVEETLALHFPEARIARIDQDTTTSKQAWQELYTKVHNHEVDILVGTQMLAKGHDFPNLTLVVGLNIDSGLYSHDFRASELLFTQLTQVGGRAGRGAKPGLVLLQTHYPNHELYQYLIKHDFSGFANYLLNQRKPLLLPPYSYYALLRVSASKLKTAMEYLAQIASLAQQLISAEIIMYPPVPAIIQRLKSRERGQILIYSQNRDSLHKFLTQLTELISQLKAKADVSWNLDVDPSEL